MNEIIFWTGTALIALGAGMGIASIAFRNLPSFAVGCCLLIVGTLALTTSGVQFQ